MKTLVLCLAFVSLVQPSGNNLAAAQPNGKSVALFVDRKFLDNLGPEIQRLANDIGNDLSANVIVETVDASHTRSEDIRARIQVLYRNDGLVGVVLIGDIPTARMGDYESDSPVITDAFYEDLDSCNWVDPDSNGIYNVVVDENGDGAYEWFYKTWIGEHNREVWSGRLQPPTSVDLQARIELLRRYLERNHQYRTGKRSYARGMVYFESLAHNGEPGDTEADSSTVYARAAEIMDESWLFKRSAGDTLVFIWDNDLEVQRDLWLSAINKPFEYGFINVHGSSDAQWLGGSRWLYADNYQNSPANTFLINLASCSNGDFRAANYLAGWTLFGGEALAVMANTTVVFQVGRPGPDPDLNLLSLGLTLGDIRLTYVLSNESSILFGDPTLRMRTPSNGPQVVADTNVVVFPEQDVQTLHEGYIAGATLTVVNKGDQSVDTYFRIISMTSIDGRVPWGGQFQSRFGINPGSFPAVVPPGESRSISIWFYYDGQSGIGEYRAKFCFYTNSSASPYAWITVEKRLFDASVPPTAPTLATPSNGVTGVFTAPTLTWNPPAGATSYHVQLSTDSTFIAVEVDDSTNGTAARAVTNLVPGTRYWWRVRARNNAGFGLWSASWSFTTSLPFPWAILLVAPGNNATVHTDSVSLVWRGGGPQVITYRVDIALDSMFMFKIVDSTVTDTFKVVRSLFDGETYFWRVCARNAGGWGPFSEGRRFQSVFTSVEKMEDRPTCVRLYENYPNPFNPLTTIRYGLPNRSHVTLTVFNTLGQQVAVLQNAEQEAGYHEVQFDASGLASGVYFYRMQAGDFVATKRLLLLR